jgi:hypothetical protein
MLYLEAFCRPGGADRDWHDTVIPSETRLVTADVEGRHIELESVVDGQVYVRHVIEAGNDEVDFHMTIEHRGDEAIHIAYAQPCLQVGDFVGRDQDDYFERCFIFTEKGLTWLHETHRATQARYAPGQVYLPGGVDAVDANPRPLSQTRPVNNLIGCVSADDTWLLAMAWDRVHELFQGIIRCIHSDVAIGPLEPGQVVHRHGKLYLLPNDVDGLLKRYRQDFRT